MEKEKQYKNCKTVPKTNQIVYGMGFLGAAIYFIAHAVTFWTGVVGTIKAFLWPAVLVYKIFEYLKL